MTLSSSVAQMTDLKKHIAIAVRQVMPQAEAKQIMVDSSALPRHSLMIDSHNQTMQLGNLLTGCLSQAIDLINQEGQKLMIECKNQQEITNPQAFKELVLRWPASFEARTGQELDQSDQNDLMALAAPTGRPRHEIHQPHCWISWRLWVEGAPTP